MINQNKKQIFRNQIRRKQMDDLFAHQRTRCLEKSLTKQHEQLEQNLNSQYKRKQWIYQIANQLKDQPNKQWFHPLRYLSMVVRVYKDCYELWIQAGIIEKLVMLLKQRNLQYGYSGLAAIILGQLFFYLPDYSNIIDKILQYQFTLDLVQLCSSGSEDDIKQYYQLVIEMISQRYYIRDKFINDGIVQHLVIKLKSALNPQSDEVFKALSLSYRLLIIYDKKGIKCKPKRYICLILIPVLEQYLMQTHRIDIIDITLKCFESLVEMECQTIYSLIASSPYVLKSVLQYLCLESNPQIRKLCASILSNFLCSKNLQHAKQLHHLGFLQKIHQCFRMQSQQIGYNENSLNQIKTTRSDNMNKTLLLALQNFVANTTEEMIALLKNQVFQDFVIPMSHQTIPLKVRYEAIYLLGTILNTKIYNIIQQLVSKYKIVQIFVINLNSNTPSLDLTIELLRNIYNLISFYDKVYTNKTNKIVDMLVRFYNIEAVLNQIEDKCQNKTVLKRIQLIHAKINGQ